MRGILVCEKHKAWGLRDIRASWHRTAKVAATDLISVCPELVGSGLDPNSFAFKEDDGRWFAPMKTFGLQKELGGSIREKLEAGIYKTDYDAFQVAFELEKERLAVAASEAILAAEAKEQELRKAAATQKQEAVGRTRLGESKEEMLMRLTAVTSGGRRREPATATTTAPAAATSTVVTAASGVLPALLDTDEDGWVTVGR
jgi:hypothetical protein